VYVCKQHVLCTDGYQPTLLGSAGD
jgi:hypothetical protein